MENKKSPSKKKLISIKEEKLIRQFGYDPDSSVCLRPHKKQLLLDLEILKKDSTQRKASQRVLVSIKPRLPAVKTLYLAEPNYFAEQKGSDLEILKKKISVREGSQRVLVTIKPRAPAVKTLYFAEQKGSDLEILKKDQSLREGSQRVLVTIKPRAPSIKTLYIAEKTRFYSGKGSEKTGSRSRLGIGDHSSFTTHYSENDAHIGAYDEEEVLPENKHSKVSGHGSSSDTKSSDTDCLSKRVNVYKNTPRSAEKCYVYTQAQMNMNLPRVKQRVKESKARSNKIDIGVFVSNPSSNDSLPYSLNTFNKLQKRIDRLERKIFKQEMVFRSIDPNIQLSSSDEECQQKMKCGSGSGRPCCSYIQQYSHVPETSAFQRYAASPASPSRATTLDKEHNSEQYGRDFTAYDGLTARGRRQCASVPCKRDDFPKLAADRVHKIRHKLNPVRDYRLMDTVHYLAQGEFAPRDDGIKLTPSREAVLSDIIWEDVCRTHWPTTRLGRRQGQERCNTRCELQRLIDSMLRERVAHVERRRRRHYRIVKLSHRHESCRPVGKTGDIIVASHKKKEDHGERGGDLHISDHNAARAMLSDRRREEQYLRRSHRSHDRLVCSESRHRRRPRAEECSPGPSCAAPRCPAREPTCCYQTTRPVNARDVAGLSNNSHVVSREVISTSSSCKRIAKNPRLVVRKETPHRKNRHDEPDLEQYILLPTLVIRTPSNVRRQKKFNELYHRILNVQMNNGADTSTCAVESEAAERNPSPCPNKKDIGLNINISISTSTEFRKSHKHF